MHHITLYNVMPSIKTNNVMPSIITYNVMARERGYEFEIGQF